MRSSRRAEPLRERGPGTRSLTRIPVSMKLSEQATHKARKRRRGGDRWKQGANPLNSRSARSAIKASSSRCLTSDRTVPRSCSRPGFVRIPTAAFISGSIAERSALESRSGLRLARKPSNTPLETGRRATSRETWQRDGSNRGGYTTSPVSFFEPLFS